MNETAPGRTQLFSQPLFAVNYKAHVLSTNLARLERFLVKSVGEFTYKGETIEFNCPSASLLKLRPQFRILFHVHRWLRDRKCQQPKISDVHEAMLAIVDRLSASSTSDDTDCELDSMVTHVDLDGADGISVNVVVSFGQSRMLIPTARMNNIVARQQEFDTVIKWLMDSSRPPRILIHGMEGVGKGELAARVVHHPIVQYCRMCLSSMSVSVLPVVPTPSMILVALLILRSV